MKKFSIILTTYNGAKGISKTLDSILDQEGIDSDFTIELIVVDDCSTDNTFSIIEKYDCIAIQNDINSGGPNKGRNKGLRLASGDYICIVDQDDIWKRNRLKALLPYLDLAPIITSGYEIIDSSRGKVTKKVRSPDKEFILYDQNQTFLKKLTKSLVGQHMYMGSIVFSNKFKEVYFEEKFGMVDFDWLLRLLHQKTSLEVCQVLYERRIDGSNLSLNDAYRKYDFYYSLMTLEEYEDQYPSLVNLCRKKINGSRARYFYLVGDMKKARTYFLRAQWNIKNLLYYMTTFAGSKFIKKHFNVFG